MVASCYKAVSFLVGKQRILHWDPFQVSLIALCGQFWTPKRTQAKRYKEASSSSESHLAHILSCGVVAFLAHAVNNHSAIDTCMARMFFFRLFFMVSLVD